MTSCQPVGLVQFLLWVELCTAMQAYGSAIGGQPSSL
jgi:hypothetical protein